ncbi:MAG: tRNA lysidine(34) synthetase TilS [Marivibrio sp.]|uniref:tRNA lysidine(34) synthetase TilS n=1 Tax=Marivibrio sp. TaxID=2039719 RepID=UPI0032EEE4D2
MTSAAARPGPVDPAQFGNALAACLPAAGPPVGLAVACSGGPDSLALALLARDWAQARGAPLKAFIVDHGLRPEAAAEAESVRARLERARVSAAVLRDPGAAPPASDVQGWARRLRYRLLLAACAEAGLGVLALAHHLEDQAETFLLRLARGSGVDGLAAMAPALDWGGVRVVRPLLDIPKARLTATVAAAGLQSVDDPSNCDPRFARVRVRERADDLAALGLTPRRLADTAGRMARARAALEGEAARLVDAAAAFDAAGFATLDREALLRAPEEIGLRALAGLIRRVGGQVYPPRLERLERLYGALGAGSIGGGRTLAGVRIAPRRDGRLLIHREPAQVTERAALAPQLLWDGRFALRFACADPRLEVRALGRDGWSHLRRRNPAAARAGAALPGPVRLCLPAVWRREEPLAAGEAAAEPLGAPHLAPPVDCPAVLALRFAGPEAVRVNC